ncbi:MAG TPA: PQQ-binding-like beta-propeller repeat protein [Gemmataceae bacterium]|nr:PQQ-binding-like beta-propeller repeat protein [Gemmataceae bacterium]
MMSVLFCLSISLARCLAGDEQEGSGSLSAPSALADQPFVSSDAQFTVNSLDKNVPATWSIEADERKNIKWMAKLGLKSFGRPIVAGGKVFVGTNNDSPRNDRVQGDKGVLMCFRESDGQFLWQAIHEPSRLLFSADNPRFGHCSAPAVEGHRLYYVSSAFELICAETMNGDMIWRLDLKKDLGVYPTPPATCSPLLVGDSLFVVTGNGVDEGNLHVLSPEAPSFIAVDKRTGKLIWKDNSTSKRLADWTGNGKGDDESLIALRNKGEAILHGQWSSPVHALVKGKSQLIFAGGDGWVRGFEATTGKPIWGFDCNPKSSKYVIGGIGTRNYFVATPVVYEDKLYIAVGQRLEHGEGVGHLWCIDISKTGNLSPVDDIWDPGHPKNRTSGLVWHYGGSIDPKSGSASAPKYAFGRSMSTCAVQGGLVYAADLGGTLHCLDAKTGSKYWQHDLGDAVWGSPYWVDGKIYIGNMGGQVHVFAHGKAKQLLDTVEMGEPVSTAPVAANGVLYVMTATRLYAMAKP